MPSIAARRTQLDHEPESLELRFREELGSLYAKAIHIPDLDKEKARVLSMLHDGNGVSNQRIRGKVPLEME
jgi:hypothetical protein